MFVYGDVVILKIGRYWPWKTVIASSHLHMPVPPTLLHRIALVSFLLFRKNLGNLREFFGQMVYRPPGKKLPVRLCWLITFVMSSGEGHRLPGVVFVLLAVKDWLLMSLSWVCCMNQLIYCLWMDTCICISLFSWESIPWTSCWSHFQYILQFL